MKEVGNISPGSTANDVTTNATPPSATTAPAKKTISTHINMIINSVEHQFKGATPTTSTIDESNNNVELMEVEENTTTISEEMDETTRLALNDIPALMRKELCLNEFWYVLDRHWYDSFLEFLKNQSAHPGKIDNSALLEPVKNSSSKNAEPNYVLKATVSENIDFVFVAEKAWNLLVEAFGTVEGMGGYPYRCPVFRRTGSYLQLELRPLELRLTLYGSKEDMVVQYSRNCTLKQVIDDMKKLFKIDENKPVQLWNNATLLVSYNGESNVCSPSTSNNSSAVSAPSTNSSSSVPRPPPPPPPSSSSNSQPVSSLDQCLLDIADLEAPGTVLTIEVENNDHTWPSSKTKSGAVTRSKYASGTPNYQPGACGLMNLGNTCFMNAAIQCLSNTSPLTKYFLADQHLADLNPDNPLGMHGEIARCYADLIKLMWSGFYTSVGPREFKVVVTQFAPQFSGFAHHDCQELMAFLLDGLHEDLNRVKVKPYRMMKNDIEKRPDDVVAAEAWRNYKLRNDSIIVDTFHAQLKSTLVCPECDLVSVTFDPFCYLSLPLPYRIERSVDIIFVPAISKRPVFAKRNPCTTFTSQSGSEQNNDVAYTISVRSILLENVLIPKIGCASDISAAVAKLLNDCAAEDPNQYFNRKFDPKKLVVANVMDSRLIKFLEPHTLYNSHFDDIVVYELDDLPTSTNSESGSTIQTRSSSKFSGHHLPVFLRQINADSSYSMLSRPFFINIKSLTYENIREAIFKELISIVPPEKVNYFLQAMEANIVEEENAMSAPNMMRRTKDDGSDGEASDDEDEEMIQNNSNNISTDFDNDDEGVDTFGGIQPVGNMKKCMAPTYTITVVNSNAQNVSVLNPGQRLESSLDTYLAINIHYRIVSKYFPSNINRCGFIRLTSMLPNLQASNTNSVLTLKECINQFTLTEKLGENDPWYCPRCKKHQMASKKFDVWSLPDNLIIHLKRFSYSRLHRDKLNVLVEFPIENLDMSPYVLHNPNNESFVYDLIAVSNHYGELGAGHYTAYGKNFRTNSWYLFDDYSVSAVPDKNKVMTKAAYVLFYQRKPQTPSTGSGDNNSMTDANLSTKLEDSQSVAPCE